MVKATGEHRTTPNPSLPCAIPNRASLPIPKPCSANCTKAPCNGWIILTVACKNQQCLPAQLPNVLLNGAMGIAVGMATDIPPHNLQEVVAGCIHVLHNPTCTVADVLTIIQGPDYPSGGEMVTPRSDLLDIYQSGRGTIKLRARYHIDDDGSIVVYELPYQVSGSKILESIAQQMHSKKTHHAARYSR